MDEQTKNRFGNAKGDPPALMFLKCLRCSYQWVPRTTWPKTCPNCKSRYWNRPRKKKNEKADR